MAYVTPELLRQLRGEEEQEIVMTDRPIDEILQDALEIAARPDTGTPTAGVPALVCPSLEEIDSARVCFLVHEGHPITIWPKGQRPHG